MLEQVIDEKYKEITDFFELLEYSAERKCEVLKKLPYSYEFTMKAHFSAVKEVDEEINKVTEITDDLVSTTMFQNIDFTKFKENVEIKKMINILMWAMEGYFIEKERMNEHLQVNEMMDEYRGWINMFRKMSYKEEYL